MRHVIIGGSIAGISAARAIRAVDADADITLVSAETVKPYYRPMIPTVIEKGDADISFIDDPVEKYRFQTMHDRASGIDPRSREVTLASGVRLHYDRLLVATGCSPVIPAVRNLPGADVFVLRTLDDARSIRAAAEEGKKRAVVIGGGFVGIKGAIALKRLGLDVTVLEKLDRILYEKLDKRGSSIITDLLKREGIAIMTDQQDYEIMRTGGAVHAVRFASSKTIAADMIVVAVGTKPNTEVFGDAGGKVNKGIVVQETLQTNIADVYAAGDVVEYRDCVSNIHSVSALWTNAEEMGRLAGKNMAGSAMKYSGFLSLMNTTEILNVPVTTIGLIEPVDKSYDMVTEGDDNSYRKLVFKKDVVVGAVFIGRAEGAGVYTHIIRNQIPLGTLKGLACRGKLRFINFLKPAA